MSDRPRIFVSSDRCTLVTMWPSGKVQVARRDGPGHTWGPPVDVEEEK